MALKRINCWEFAECGREPDGKNTAELGICPATNGYQHDGINRGTNAGRFCWVVAGTFCNSKPQGTFAVKLENCLKCNFFLKVQKEEDRAFTLLPSE